MLYVALSRVTRESDIRMCIENSVNQGRRDTGSPGGDRNKANAVYFTQNIVNLEILQHIPDFVLPHALTR